MGCSIVYRWEDFDIRPIPLYLSRRAGSNVTTFFSGDACGPICLVPENRKTIGGSKHNFGVKTSKELVELIKTMLQDF